jgi:hypothetical protein
MHDQAKRSLVSPDEQPAVGFDPDRHLRRVHNMAGHQRVQFPHAGQPSAIRRVARMLPSWSSTHRS